MQHRASGIDDWLQQRSGQSVSSRFGLIVFAVGDRCPGNIDKEWVREAGVGERPCQPIYRRRTHHLILLLSPRPTPSLRYNSAAEHVVESGRTAEYGVGPVRYLGLLCAVSYSPCCSVCCSVSPRVPMALRPEVMMTTRSSKRGPPRPAT